MSESVALTLEVRASGDSRDQILAILRSLVGPAIADPGCEWCHLSPPQNDPTLVVFTQRWRSLEELQREVSRNQYQRLLAAMDLAEEEPVVRLEGVIGRDSGIDALASLYEAEFARQ